MGIYDREYYQGGDGGGPAWFGGVAPWCKTIILINAVVFLGERAFHINSDFLAEWFAASPKGIFEHGRVWQLLTATFMHGNIWHILGNMWILWIVGREMESLYGGRDFLAFYLAAAIASTLFWAVARTFAPGGGYMVGASGAVMAVLTLYTLYYPRREIYLLVFPMPMWGVLVLFLIWPLLAGGQSIAVESHLAGAAFGYLFKRFDLRWSRLVPQRMSRPRLKIVFPGAHDQPRTRGGGHGRTTSEAVGGKGPRVSVMAEEEQFDARLDEILAKIAREGRAALTEEEQRVLQEASQRARDRRGDRR